MCKQFLYLIFFVLLLGLVLTNTAEAQLDPNLVGWWKFDETSGTTVHNSASYSNLGWPSGTLDGVINGNPQWATGYRNGAILLDADEGTNDYVSFPSSNFGDLISELQECTFSIWVNFMGGANPVWQRIMSINTMIGNNLFIVAQTGAASPTMRICLKTTAGPWGNGEMDVGVLPTGSWHHVAATVSRANRTMIFYLDGNIIGSQPNLNINNSVDQLGKTTNNWLGRSQWTDPYFNGYLDDFKIYNRVLTQPEIKKAANPERASIPVPAEDIIINQTDLTLQWEAGLYAADVEGHYVYFGDNFDDVNAGTGGTDKGLTSSPSYSLTNLIQGQTYYWRIDEVNGIDTWRGDIWSFTIQPLTAYNPSPPDGIKYFNPNADLAWSPGAKANRHDIYLGTNFDNVNNATRTNQLGVLAQQDHDANTYDPGTLEFDTTYYWRIDEVNDTNSWKGNVWTLETMPTLPVYDPQPVGWWKLDEGEGRIAADWSGNYNHGTIMGPNDPMWLTDGQIDGALQFNGIDDYVELPVGSIISSLPNSTMTIWVNFSNPDGGVLRPIFNFGLDTDNFMYLSPRFDTAGAMRASINFQASPTDLDAQTGTLDNGWHHVAVVLEPTNFQIYLDGQSVGRTVPSAVLSDLGVTTDNWLGKSPWPNDAYFDGDLDDFRIYDRALSQEEIVLVMRGDPLLAWNPGPSHGSTPDIEHVYPLSWSPGEEATQHYVYFGTDPNAVRDANESDTTGIYQGLQLETTYTPSEVLQRGQTYYWRIDELNTDATITKGSIWSFTVADYLVVDDFEGYDDFDPNRIFDTWKDYSTNNSGATVGYLLDTPYAEMITVHEGLQSMPLFYDNDGTVNEGTSYETSGTEYYSQTDRTWDTPQDWTRKGTTSLTLWLQGYRASVGGISYNAGPSTYTMTGSGTDINDVTAPRETGFHDEFHFAYKELSGEGEIIAKVESIQNTDEWAKAGVMIRNKETDSQTPEADSAYAMVFITPAQGVAFQYRTERGDTSTTVQDVNISAPHWVRLTRSGNTFTAYHSEDGQTWLSIGDAVDSWMEIPTMNVNTYIGLALTSNDPDVACEAVFSNVSAEAASGSTITPTGPFTTSQDVGIFSNDADKLYVILEDNNGNFHLVEHPDPNATQIYPWQEWNIDLREFSSEGVNLAAIKKMSIGVGDPEATSPSGEGKIYIDDIRIFPLRCVPEFVKPAGDFSDNCVVDYLDIQIIADNWLINGGWDVTPVAPSGANLVAHYEFNGNFNNSSNGYHGDANGASIVTDPVRGQVARFDGVDDNIALPIGSLISSLTNSTFATWVDFLNIGGDWQRIFDFGSDTNIYMFLSPRIEDDVENGQMRFAITIGSNAEGAEQISEAADTLASGWHHVAVTIDADNGTISLYLDGLLVDENTAATLTPSDLGETTNNWLGRSQWEADAYFGGSLDDFRIYNRALTQGEIGSLAGRTAVYTQPLDVLLRPTDSAIDMNSDGTINFKDYAELASIWLEEQLWPEL